MPPDPARQPPIEVSGSLPGPGSRTRRRATATGRRWRWRWRWRLAIAAGLIAAGLIAAFARSELDPKALAEADAAYRSDDMRTALRMAKGHLARRPSSRRAALLAARCLSRLGRPDQAEPYYQQAGTLDLEDRHIRAYALVVNGRHEPAIRAYREILASRPDDVLALSRMGGILISQGRWSDALEPASRLIKTTEGAVVGHTLAGVVYYNMHDPELALYEFDRVLELDPDLARMPLKPPSMFWLEYGYSLLSVGRWAEARRHLLRVLDEGNDARVADLLGQSYHLEGAFDDAERYWRLAILWEPDRVGTWWRIGKLELQRGRIREAVEPLRRAIAIQPTAIGPLYTLSLAYRRLGRIEESDRLTEQVQRLRGKATTPLQDDLSAGILRGE